MVQFTPQEEKALSKALWKAADGIKEMRKILTDMGNRLGMEWRSASPEHLRDLAGFVADNGMPSDFLDKHFCNDSYWSKHRLSRLWGTFTCCTL